jgi:sterol desaturase/sphingolipid hydroxylase (fatty acid hydroxylase superfamily)
MMIIPDGILNSAQGVAYLAIEVVSGIFLYDTIFFFIHLAMHACKFIAKICKHHKHHKATKNLEARHVLEHSLFDGVL